MPAEEVVLIVHVTYIVAPLHAEVLLVIHKEEALQLHDIQQHDEVLQTILPETIILTVLVIIPRKDVLQHTIHHLQIRQEERHLQQQEEVPVRYTNLQQAVLEIHPEDRILHHPHQEVPTTRLAEVLAQDPALRPDLQVAEVLREAEVLVEEDVDNLKKY